MPPEMNLLFMIPKPKRYTKSVDVWAAGLMVVQIIGLLGQEELLIDSVLPSYSSDVHRGNFETFVENIVSPYGVESTVLKMLANRPDDRLSSEEARDRLKKDFDLPENCLNDGLSSGEERDRYKKDFKLPLINTLSKQPPGSSSSNSLLDFSQSSSNHQQRKKRGIQFLIMMDCTGSMGSYLNEAVQKCIQLVDNISRISSPCYLGFVGYRDYGDSNRFQVYDFTEDVGQLKRWLETLGATGGSDDEPEDVVGGLEQAVQLAWLDDIEQKIIFHIGDAGGHGRLAEPQSEDRFPDGGPEDEPLEPMVDFIKENGIEYFFGRINNRTERMIAEFERVGLLLPENVIEVEEPIDMCRAMVKSVEKEP